MNNSLFILAVVELVVKHGIPATIAIINSWGVENPTLEDIEALRKLVPAPETYFEEVPE